MLKNLIDILKKNSIEKIVSIPNLPSTTYSKSLTNNLPNITNIKAEITEINENMKPFSIYLSIIVDFLNLLKFNDFGPNENLRYWVFLAKDLIELIFELNFNLHIL